MSNRTNELTAMERFRAALEKCGIEFETSDDECAEGEERTTTFKANFGEDESDIFVTAKDWYFDGKLTPWLNVEFHSALTPEQAVAATLGDETPKKCSTCLYRYCVGQRPYPSFGYRCGFGDGKNLCGSNTSVLDHMCCEHWEKELR